MSPRPHNLRLERVDAGMHLDRRELAGLDLGDEVPHMEPRRAQRLGGTEQTRRDDLSPRHGTSAAAGDVRLVHPGELTDLP